MYARPQRRAFSRLRFQRQAEGKGGALPLTAVQRDGAVVISHGVLDDGQAQSGTAGGLGVALVHAVEALEDAALVLRRDTDTGIGHRDHGVGAVTAHGDGDAAAVLIVLDGVVAEVEDRLGQQTADAGDREHREP